MASIPEARHPQPKVITDAKSGTSQEFSTRQRNYMIAMAARTVCFLGSVILFFTHVINIWVFAILFVAAVVLPSVAVVLANQPNTRTQKRVKFERPEPTEAPQLTTGPDDEVISGTVEDEFGPITYPSSYRDHVPDHGA